MKKQLLGAIVLLSAVTSAHAELIRIDFQGLNSSPTQANVFGAPVPNVSGYVVYESTAVGSQFSTFNGLTYNFANAIREVGFNLYDPSTGSTSVFSGQRLGSFGSAQIRDGNGNLEDNISFNNLILTGPQVVGEPAGFTQVQLTLRLATDGNPALNPWTATSLPGVFDPAMFDGQRNLQVSIARTAGSQPTGVAVNFNYNLSSLEVTPVPLPAAAWMLLSGLGGFAAFARRRRKPSGPALN